MGDKTRGVYRKFEVRRTDGSSEQGGKHEQCEYFVLDLTHDKHALAALEAYAESCKSEYPGLYADLCRATNQMRKNANAGRPEFQILRLQ